MSSLKQKPSVSSSSTTTSPYCKIETPKYLYRSNQQIPSELNPVFIVQISSNTLRHLQLPAKSMTTEGIRPPPSISSHTDSASDVRCEMFRLFKGEEKGKETTVDLTGGENKRDEFLQLMIEKKVLEYEKVKAETELHFWKDSISFAKFIPKSRALVFPMVKHPFVVGFLVAELPKLEIHKEEDDLRNLITHMQFQNHGNSKIRGPLSRIRTLSKMLSVNMKKKEISYDIVEDMMVLGDRMRETLQQLQDVVHMTKNYSFADVVRGNCSTSIEVEEQQIGSEVKEMVLKHKAVTLSAEAINERESYLQDKMVGELGASGPIETNKNNGKPDENVIPGEGTSDSDDGDSLNSDDDISEFSSDEELERPVGKEVENFLNGDKELKNIINYKTNETDVECNPESSPNGLSLSPSEPRVRSVKEHLDLQNEYGSNPCLKSKEIIEKGDPLELQGVSEKMRLLLSRDTPIKEKLGQIIEGIKSQKQHLDDPIEATQRDCKIATMERRVTRSQSSKRRRPEDRHERHIQQISKDSSSNSIGISIRLDEIGSSCGFHRCERSRKINQNAGKKGASTGKK
ncbi:hypothetical protein L2E82_51123 [Cichorium intybus]|nr:hypothetical protein L2E82_51123 [Cichorium intybus]